MKQTSTMLPTEATDFQFNGIDYYKLYSMTFTLRNARAVWRSVKSQLNIEMHIITQFYFG